MAYYNIQIICTHLSNIYENSKNINFRNCFICAMSFSVVVVYPMLCKTQFQTQNYQYVLNKQPFGLA